MTKKSARTLRCPTHHNRQGNPMSQNSLRKPLPAAAEQSILLPTVSTRSLEEPCLDPVIVPILASSTPQRSEKVKERVARPAASEAKALIAAHRAAKKRHDAAKEAYRQIKWPNRVHVIVPEIGAQCTVYDLDQLDRLEREHIDNHGLTGMDRIEFVKRIRSYRDALVILTDLYEGWRVQSKIGALETEECAASDEVDAAWKALIARIKMYPRDIPAIARYFAAHEASGDNFWRPREVLRAIAAAG